MKTRSTRCFLLLLFCLGFLFSANAQCTGGGCGPQLVPNNGFETPSGSCSISDIQLYNTVSPVQSWFGTDNYPGAGSSPDFYFPGCGGTATFSCQVGSGFTGIYTKTHFAAGREYIQAQLNAPLIAGHRYCFSMQVRAKAAAAGPTVYGGDGIGAWFNNIGLINIQTMNGGQQFLGAGSMINATPQIQNAAGNIIGTTCFTLTGEFCAAGGESWVVIGNFNTDAATTTSATSGGMSYMYIDEVSLKESCNIFDDVLSAAADTVCTGSCTTISSSPIGGSGTYTYLWVPGGQTTASISACPAGAASTYTLYTSTLSTCGTALTDTSSITIYTSICAPHITLTDTTVCAGSCVTLTPVLAAATPPYTYLWSQSAQTTPAINVCAAATTSVWVQVTDVNGTVFSDTAVITVNPFPTANAGMDDTICQGSADTLIASGGGTYQWLGGPATAAYIISPAASADYIVTVVAAGCADTDTVRIVVENPPVVTVSHTDVSCYGLSDGTVNASVSGPAPVYHYLWNPLGGTAASMINIPPNNYQVQVTDDAGCMVTGTVTVTQPAALTAAISGRDTVCASENIQLTGVATGGTAAYSYNWLPGNIPLSVLNTAPAGNTTYSLVVTDNHNCLDTATVNVIVENKPHADFTGPVSGCAPVAGSFINNSLGAASFQWNLDDGFSSIAVNPSEMYTAAGCKDISLIATAANGCSDTLVKPCLFTVYALPEAGLSVSEPVVSEISPDVSVTNTSSGAVQCTTWFGDGTVVHDCDVYLTHHYDSVGVYTITQVVLNSNGCSDTTFIQVEVKSESTIWIPNAFTPDGNGLNDVFMAKGYGVKNFQMMIFNRWGEKIFESDNIDRGWDGTFKNAPVQQDVYVYVIFYTNSRLAKEKLVGNVNLVR